MIRKAKLTDFPLVFPILKQIFDEMIWIPLKHFQKVNSMI